MNNQFPKAAVLLSTYNGERFLQEQIESILKQKEVSVDVLVRDDGSKDSTTEILQGFGDKVRLLKGNNVGVGNSFMNVLYEAGTEYEYYAFSDQDDIWLEDKLARAIGMIGSSETPVLYCSNQMLVDGEGSEIGLRHQTAPGTGWMQILNNNYLSGCTMVWNKALQTALADPARKPSEAMMKKRIHDVWVGMTASVTGRIIYDPEARIQYRQHENNVVGVRHESVLKTWKKKINDPELRNGRSMLAEEISRKFSDLIPDQTIRDKLKVYGDSRTHWKARLKTLFDPDLSRYSGEPRWQLMIKIIAGLF